MDQLVAVRPPRRPAFPPKKPVILPPDHPLSPKKVVHARHKAWMLALLVPSSSHGMPDSFRHAVDLYDAPSRDGDAAANAGMGTLELYGWGVPRDLHKCLGHFRFANQRKHARGQTGLGVMHVHGFVVARDFNEAFKYLSDGCDQKDPIAMYELGYMYLKNRGVPLNWRKGVFYLEQAAALGHALAQFELGNMYFNGTPVHPVSLQRALSLFQLSAHQGFEASVPAISLTVDALWSPDIDGQICKATMLEVQTYRDVELEEERTRRTTRDAEDEEARVEALIARLKLEVEIKRDLAVQLARTKERIVAETARAERAETNLALTKEKLKKTKVLLEEVKEKVAKLKNRVEFLLLELRRKPTPHTVAGGKWEGVWMPHETLGARAMADLSPKPSVFRERWTCCDCTHYESYYCKPFCGCGKVSQRYCEDPPRPPTLRSPIR